MPNTITTKARRLALAGLLAIFCPLALAVPAAVLNGPPTVELNIEPVASSEVLTSLKD